MKHFFKKNLHKPRIIADYREKNSDVPFELLSLGCEVEFHELKVADFIIGNIAVERKTISDFLSSMLNKRLIRQLQELQQYKKKLLIIEGTDEQEVYNEDSNLHPNSVRGFLLTILLNYKIPILFTKNSKDSAKFMNLIARKEKHEPSSNAKKKARNKKEQMQYILESFPGIGPKTAKKLLGKFKTLKEIFNLPVEKLKNEIGKKAEIFSILKESF